MKKILYILLPLLVFLLAGMLFVYFRPNLSTSAARLGMSTNANEHKADVIVRIVAEGFEPQEITVSKGDTVLWKNESNEYRWPASNLHPSHRIYSEFDPKEPLGPGESWAFTFERAGAWQYHDHLRPSKRGTVEVQDE